MPWRRRAAPTLGPLAGSGCSRAELTGGASASKLGLHPLELGVDFARARELPGPLVDVVLAWSERRQILEGPRGFELLHRVGPGLHVLGLVERALHREADVRHLLADAGGRLRDPHLRLGGRVLRLDDFLLGAELLELRPEL